MQAQISGPRLRRSAAHFDFTARSAQLVTGAGAASVHPRTVWPCSFPFPLENGRNCVRDRRCDMPAGRVPIRQCIELADAPSQRIVPANEFRLGSFRQIACTAAALPRMRTNNEHKLDWVTEVAESLFTRLLIAPSSRWRRWRFEKNERHIPSRRPRAGNNDRGTTKRASDGTPSTNRK